MTAKNKPANKLLASALDLARRGFRVFPLWGLSYDMDADKLVCTCQNGHACGRRSGKHPRIKEWDKAATTDEAQIIAWWTRHPDSNIGLALGQCSVNTSVWVLDVDGEQGERELAKLPKLPKTFEVTTGNGRHLYFWGSSDCRPIAPGLDVRGEGGYVVAPPSLHLEGRTYTASGHKLAELERNTLPYMSEGGNEGRGLAHLAPLELAPEGAKADFNNLTQERAPVKSAPPSASNKAPSPARARKESGGQEAAGGDLPPNPSPALYSAPRWAAIVRWSREALAVGAEEVRGQPAGGRSTRLNAVAYRLGRLIAGGALSRSEVERELAAAALGAADPLPEGEVRAKLAASLDAGGCEPHDFAGVGVRAGKGAAPSGSGGARGGEGVGLPPEDRGREPGEDDDLDDEARAANFLAALNEAQRSQQGEANSQPASKAPAAAPAPAPARPHNDAKERNRKRPQVTLVGDLEDQSWRIIDLLEEVNQKAPVIFWRGPSMVRVVPERGRETISPVGSEELRSVLGENYRFASQGEEGPETMEAAPRSLMAYTMTKRRRLHLPPLEEVLLHPVFDPQGRLVATNGYHKSLAAWLDLGDQEEPQVPEAPTSEDLAWARGLIDDELLGEFPWEDAGRTTLPDGTTKPAADEGAALAHAVALGLLPFVRPMIDGPTPLHLISAPTPGTGKSYLAECLARVSGAKHRMFAPAGTEEEWRKRVSTILLEAPGIVQLDNLSQEHMLDSASLATVLTARRWNDRLIGTMEPIDVEIRCGWVATANGPKLTKELTRRSVWIPLNAKMADPTRRAFARDLSAWVEQERVALQQAFLLLVQNWINKGRPAPKYSNGSYPAWSYVLGGILEAAGYTGFGANERRMKSIVDGDTGEWQGFITCWWDKYEQSPVGVRELYQLAIDNDLLMPLFGGANEAAAKVKLAKALAKRFDMIFELEQPLLAVQVKAAGANANKHATLYQLKREAPKPA